MFLADDVSSSQWNVLRNKKMFYSAAISLVFDIKCIYRKINNNDTTIILIITTTKK
jgi:hypothetical protein